MCGRKKIYQLFKIKIFQLLTQITLLSRSRFSVFEMKITQSRNKLFSSGAIIASSLGVWPCLHGGIFSVLLNSYRCLSEFRMKLVYFNSGAPAAEGRQAEPHTHIRKLKGTHELIFSCVSWLAVLLVGAYARRRRRRRRRRWWSRATWRPQLTRKPKRGFSFRGLSL